MKNKLEEERNKVIDEINIKIEQLREELNNKETSEEDIESQILTLKEENPYPDEIVINKT